uniref:Antivin/lefty n=1 Tax=Paracentrotus lividus TaxID=7656 RepID=Q6T265_PARLI|nr:antivin/lefty [Paracentrotus lividus]
MELSHGAPVFIATLVVLVVITTGAPLEAHLDLQMDILDKIGVTEPWKFPSVDASTLTVPDHLRFQYESMHRQHRVRRAYITKGIHKNEEIYGEVSYTERNRQLFTFDISSIPEGSEVIMAELKVYKERPNHSIFKPEGEEGEAPHSNNHDHVHSALVSIKQLVDQEVDMDAEPADLADEVVNQHDGMDTITIDQREMTLKGAGWKVFDVTNTIQTWVADSDSNLGVALHIDPIEGGHHAQQVVDEMVFATDFFPETPDSPDSRPVLVIYTTKYAPASDEPNECRYEGEEEHRCCRRRKYVDFRDLSWTSRWIIEPAGFEAFDCYGPCHNPRSRHIRDVFRLPFFGASSSGSSIFGAGSGGHRTCGVSRSSSLPMMYLSETPSGTVELKVEEIPNMIVEDCGCQL